MRRLLIALCTVAIGTPVVLWLAPMNGCTSRRAGKPAELSVRLREHVRHITETWPARNTEHPETLRQVADHIAGVFADLDLEVEHQTFTVDGAEYRNVSAFLGPRQGPRIVVGAHYDVAGAGPGADDNASGVAGLLELAQLLSAAEPNQSVELVAYTLEEPPHFATDDMGSAHHARKLAADGVEVELMISLEMLGFYSEVEGSQEYPSAMLRAQYPSQGNYMAVVGRLADCDQAKAVQSSLMGASPLPVERLCVPGWIEPGWIEGVALSDHRNYWEHGFHAIMITDTAYFRNPHYHETSDTYDTLDYTRMASAVSGIAKAVVDLAR